MSKFKKGVCEQCRRDFEYIPKNRKGRFCSKGCFKSFKSNKVEIAQETPVEPVINKIEKSRWAAMVDKLRGIFRK